MLRPPRKSIPIEIRHPVQKCGHAQKVCSSELGKKGTKRILKRKKITQLNIIFHPFAPLTLLSRFVPISAHRVTPPT